MGMYDQAKREDLCEHMRDLVDYAISHNVEWGGCGDCGSPWLECKICDLQIDECYPQYLRKKE